MKYWLFITLTGAILCSCSPLSETNNTPNSISGAGRRAYTAYLTKNQLSHPVLAWTEEDTVTKEKFFLFSISQDNGSTFSSGINVPIEPTTSFHAEGMPKIAFRKNGDIYVFYEMKLSSESNKFAGEIHYTISKDGGDSWSAPIRLHRDSMPNKSWSFMDVGVLNNGELGVCWLDNSREKNGRPVKFSKTNSDGNFTTEIIVDSIACPCCRTSIYSDMSGNIHIVYRDVINDSIRDISVASSYDNGITFKKPVCFSGDQWNINGCPHNGPDVICNGKNIYATWFTGAKERGVYFASLGIDGKMNDKQKISGEGRYIQLASMSESKQVLVYNQTNLNANQNISFSIEALVLPDNKKITLRSSSTDASIPVVLGINAKEFLVAWIENQQVFYKKERIE